MQRLSHYTSRTGFEGIARTKSFWATNFLDLEDTSEYSYAWSIVQRDALGEVWKQLPDDIKLTRNDRDLDRVAENSVTILRDQMRQTDGYGHLYVVSFARGLTEDHNRRGILSLWDRYTRHEGYCLQFDRGDIEHLVRLDSWKSNYGVAGLHEVHYGVNKSTWTYKQLMFQVTQLMLARIAQERGDPRIQPTHEKMWAESAVLRKTLEFCAIHKDPCFEEEREIRLFFYPSSESDSRVFTGLASVKQIRRTSEGKRYIVIGEHWSPGIIPRRLIIGTRANPEIIHVLAHYNSPPEIGFANLPLARRAG